jgi:hypothetical protein
MLALVANVLAAICTALLRELLQRRDLIDQGRQEALADESSKWILALKFETEALARPDGGVGTIGVRPGAQGLLVSRRDADPDGSADADHLP